MDGYGCIIFESISRVVPLSPLPMFFLGIPPPTQNSSHHQDCSALMSISPNPSESNPNQMEDSFFFDVGEDWISFLPPKTRRTVDLQSFLSHETVPLARVPKVSETGFLKDGRFGVAVGEISRKNCPWSKVWFVWVCPP